jgi:hypothetical protein
MLHGGSALQIGDYWRVRWVQGSRDPESFSPQNDGPWEVGWSSASDHGVLAEGELDARIFEDNRRCSA